MARNQRKGKGKWAISRPTTKAERQKFLKTKKHFDDNGRGHPYNGHVKTYKINDDDSYVDPFDF